MADHTTPHTHVQSICTKLKKKKSTLKLEEMRSSKCLGVRYCKAVETRQSKPLGTYEIIIIIIIIIKVKVTLTDPKAQRGSRGIAPLVLDLGARRGWVVSTTTRSLYPRERPGTHCTGGWVGPRAGLDRCEKSRPNRDSIPGPSSP
jgi:hypothetical protein